MPLQKCRGFFVVESGTSYWNDFNETISRLTFKALKLYRKQMSNTSPKLVMDDPLPIVSRQAAFAVYFLLARIHIKESPCNKARGFEIRQISTMTTLFGSPDVRF